MVTEYDAAAFGARMQTTPYAAKRLGWKRFDEVVTGKVAAAAPAIARAREEAAARDRHVRRTRDAAHGMGELRVRADIATINTIYSAITLQADALKESLPEASADERRIAALSILANPAAHPIPAKVRTAVQLIHPADVFPFAVNTSRRMDLDHAIPHSEGGKTGIGNLGPLTRTHHRIKTHHREIGQTTLAAAHSPNSRALRSTSATHSIAPSSALSETCLTILIGTPNSTAT